MLLAGCLERNPDWDRPGEVEETTSDGSDTVADATGDTSSQGSMTTGDGDGDSGTTGVGDGDGDGDGDTTDTTGDGDGDLLNGCSQATALDLRGMSTVVISDISAWMTGHHACIIVDAGSTVRWEAMSFDAHGLVGGEAGMADASSPITAAGPGAGSIPIDVVLPDAGVFPYYCELHPMNMFGVIYVV